VDLAEAYAWLMASELRAVDIDFALAPFLGPAGERGGQDGGTLHADPVAVAELGQAMVRGMRLAGMSAVPGDFPGGPATGWRDMDDARYRPFADAMASGAEAMMIASGAHGRTAMPMRAWINGALRGEPGFRGLVIADAGAPADLAGSIHACHDAGCDLIAVRRPERIEAALDAVRDLPPCDPADVFRLRGAIAATWSALEDNPQRDEFIARIRALDGEQS